MPRLVNRFTGSVVNVPDEKVEGLRARGFDAQDDKASKSTPAKKASSTKSNG